MSDQLPAWKAPGAEGGKLAASCSITRAATGSKYGLHASGYCEMQSSREGKHCSTERRRQLQQHLPRVHCPAGRPLCPPRPQSPGTPAAWHAPAAAAQRAAARGGRGGPAPTDKCLPKTEPQLPAPPLLPRRVNHPCAARQQWQKFIDQLAAGQLSTAAGTDTGRQPPTHPPHQTIPSWHAQPGCRRT